jgi:site-specific recombinase XerC
MRTPQPTPKTLTDGEVRALLVATGRAERDLRDHVLLLVAVSTGLRVSELVALDVGDVRNGKGVRSVVTLRAETTKGKKGGEVVLAEKVRRRVVAFLVWKERRREALDDGAPLFCSRGGGPAGATRGARLSTRSAQHIFGAWQARAGFERRVHFHILRHCYATRLLRETKNLRLVQIACRHSSPATTAIYTHPSMQERVQAADSLDW